MDSDNARYLLLLPEQTDLNSHSFPIKQETFQHKNMNNVGFYFTTDRIFICWVISKWTVLQLICLPIHWNCYLLNSNNFKFIYKKAISFTPLSSTHQAYYWIVWKKKVKEKPSGESLFKAKYRAKEDALFWKSVSSLSSSDGEPRYSFPKAKDLFFL